ncbi:MAG: GH92 family glycosyl hydrolase [Prevotellaceae bacterium]|jgi:predicted alpha-1,2-mannosidase|nr:GH92 family glycosyl hydrolase [Prevotellaceae bacterium]
MKKILAILILAGLLVSCGDQKKEELYKLVNPLIGTAAHGHTFPGAIAPFGMVQLSPDTRLDSWDGCSGYHYSDNIIYGFSHTHLSGTGCLDYGDILLMPTTGEPTLSNEISDGNTAKSYPSKFQHKNEMAEAGYYSVIIDDYNIKAELTATERTGYHKYRYPSSTGNIIIDLKHRDKVLGSSIKIVSDTEIEGYRRSQSWAADQHLYFIIHLSQPINRYGISLNDAMVEGDYVEGTDIKAFVSFEAIQEPIVVTVGISALSIANARRNITHKGDFDTALEETRRKWNNELAKIEIEALSRNDKVVFYTSLYHAMTAPNLYSDVNGQYRGRDLQIHNTNGFDYYTVFSLWDTYRSAHPLLAIIDQKRTSDFIETFLLQYQQGGALPVWELSSNETGCMIGYHAIPVIYDAYMKGIRDFDTDLALEAMIHSATMKHLGIPHYMQYGFISSENEGESVSKTLEYAYDDWCIAMFAKELGKGNIYTEFIQRAQYYKNLFDAETGFFRAKLNNGWFAPFDPREVNFNYTEANAWQYSFYVPHDINTHIDMIGGDEAYTKKLDRLFAENTETTGRIQADITGLIGQYAHGNEPSHSFAYLYNYVRQAWKGQERIREIMSTLYANAPDGLCGNEDCGQMSSWYVISALGFYPVCPGDGKLIIGSPMVKSAAVKLENGKTFTVKTANQADGNVYIDKIKLNGQPYTKSYITYDDIFSGSEIVFYMTDKPNKAFGSIASDRPRNEIAEHRITPVPYFKTDGSTFFDTMTVAIVAPADSCQLYYTVDGSEPTVKSQKYTGPFDVAKTTTVKALAYHPTSGLSKAVSTTFSKIPKQRSIELHSQYANQYSAGGNNALIDFIRGGQSFSTGAWQGYQGVDLIAVIDLGKQEKISRLSTGFLQDSRSWIFFPRWVEYYISNDGDSYTLYGKAENSHPLNAEEVTIKKLEVRKPANARCVKAIAKSVGVCPDWHPGAGNPCWLFADEITIE